MRATEKSVNRRRKQSRRGDLTERLIKILLPLAEACARFPQNLAATAGSQDRRLFFRLLIYMLKRLGYPLAGHIRR